MSQTICNTSRSFSFFQPAYHGIQISQVSIPGTQVQLSYTRVQSVVQQFTRHIQILIMEKLVSAPYQHNWFELVRSPSLGKLYCILTLFVIMYHRQRRTVFFTPAVVLITLYVRFRITLNSLSCRPMGSCIYVKYTMTLNRLISSTNEISHLHKVNCISVFF